MSEEVSFIEWVFRGATGLILASGSYLFVKANNNSEDISSMKLDHANYKLEAERRLTDIVSDMQEKILDVLEDHRKESRESMTEIRADIKNLMNKTP